MKNLDRIQSRRPDIHREQKVDPLEDIIKFIDENHITSREIEIAYELTLGVYENNPEEPPREEVYFLVKKIDEQTKNGLPLNSIQDLIQQK